jgi:DNA processing protein
MPNDNLAWLRWVLIPQLGLKRSHQLLNIIDSPQALFLHPDRWPLPDSIKQSIREMNLLGEQHPIHRRALEQLQWAEQNNHQLIVHTDEQYPNQLSVIEDAPLVFWAVGKAELLHSKQVGIVGSRHASHNAERHARSISRDLALAGLTITSGGAKGIDANAHQSSLDQQGNTVAVLGCGVDVVYPKVNRTLFSNISQHGLLLSEYPLGTQPRPGHFPRRNRLISALSDVIVVVEAALKSGSLVTASHALDQGKDIFAMPGDIGNPNSEGCHRLIQDGAFLLSSADDILRHLDWHACTSATTNELPMQNLTPVQQQILSALQSAQQPIDMLAHILGLAVHQLLEPILELEMNGVIEQQPGGYTLCDIA